MNSKRSYLDAVNAGRQRRPYASLEQLNRSLDTLEQRIERNREEVAGRDVEAVLEQAGGDGGTLPTGGAGDKRDPVVGHQYPLVELSGVPGAPTASARWAAAPRRSAWDSEASVIIWYPIRAAAFPSIPVLA